MQRLPKQIAVAELTTGSVDLAATPQNTVRTISACSVTNKSGAARTVTATIKPAGGSARYVAFNQSVPAGRTVVLSGAIAQTLGPGDVFAAFGDAAGALDIVASAYDTNA